MLDNVFGSPDAWPDSDLIGYSDEFDPALALVSYRCGVFPMPVEQWMGWWSPLRRAVLPPCFCVSKMARMTRSFAVA